MLGDYLTALLIAVLGYIYPVYLCFKVRFRRIVVFVFFFLSLWLTTTARYHLPPRNVVASFEEESNSP